MAAFWTLHLVWRLHGVWRIRRAGTRRILAPRHRIWHEVHAAEANDLRFGPGGKASVPAPPFEFVEELLSGAPREGLIVSGATEDEAIRFARALMTRIQALHEAVVLNESREARPDEGRRTIKTA